MLCMRKLPLSILCALALCACNVQEQGKDAPQVSFRALQEQSGSVRTSLDPDFHVLWNSGDALTVFSSGSPGGEQFVISQEDDGKAEATFTGNSVGSAPFYALYPASAGASFDGTAISFTLPGTQDYAAGSFSQGSNPMVAKATDDIFKFKNLCGMLTVRLKGSATITSLSVKSNKAEALWGPASVSMDYTDVPVLVLDAPSDEAHSTLTLDCGEGVTLGDTATDFFFVIPAGTLSEGFTLTATDATLGRMVRQTFTNVEIKRSRCNPMAAIAYVQTESPFLSIDNYGVYDISSGTPIPIKEYTRTVDQLALRSYINETIFRIQSLETKTAILVTVPVGMEIGGSYSVKLESVGSTGIANATVTATLVKSQDGRLWLEEESGGRGFIIAGTL